ncbi:hypothetical protein Ami103574_10740 [Aminipila butyrica]|uniref:Helix-turn-helix domain-containing protein n=1 Tax=Aminipila butyrica TaxID=433296 RepID=A0A858C069_9FIRM|nr:helix-turn-helix domain-containing protein [Aminipila butyrica]QIB69766.1 hypothetical protein Ami103574_10740 [Aminipila butyrica]
MNTITAQRLIYKESLSLKAQSVFLYLADRSNKENICWPGLKRIAEDCRISVSTVQRAIKELLSIGLLMKKANFRANGSQTSNVYIVTDDAGEKEQVKVENKRIQEKMQARMKEQAKKMKLAAAVKNKLISSLSPEIGIDENRVHEEKLCKAYTKIQEIKGTVCTFLKKAIFFSRGGGQNDQPIT